MAHSWKYIHSNRETLELTGLEAGELGRQQATLYFSSPYSEQWLESSNWRWEGDRCGKHTHTHGALVCVGKHLIASFWIWETWHIQQGKHTACSSSTTGRYISRDSSPASLYCPITAQAPKEEPGRPGWLPQVGVSDPTLWELLSGELQDRLDITGLRGGLPRTNVLLFKSA